jgi:DNA-binding transcriptional LysR family regulator
MLAAFRDAQTDIRLELIVDNRFFSLSKRDADVAIRPSAAPPETLVGRRVSAIATAIYGAAGYLEAAPPLDRLDEHDWIAPDDSLATLPSARWLRATIRQTEPVLRTNTLMGMLAAAKAGLGLAALPCFLGAVAPELRRVRPPLDALASELWLLTHRDLQHVARLQAFLDFAHRSLRRMQDRFDGRSP